MKGHYTQLTLNERQLIEHMLNDKKSLSQISSILDRDVSGLRREIKNYRTESKKANQGSYLNDCVHITTCRKRFLCGGLCTFRGRPCRSCSLCNERCEEFKKAICPQLIHTPYVCNGCPTRVHCKRTKYFYFASLAHHLSLKKRSESRMGHGYTSAQLQRLEALIVPLIKNQSQSIHHVYVHNQDHFPMSERHLYTLIDQGLFQVRNLDLPTKVRFKQRKKGIERKIEPQCRQGRTYLDFLEYLKDNPGTPVVEMDTVEGRKGESVLLTLYFRICSLQLFIKRVANTSFTVIEIINQLYDRLGHDHFTSLFPCILTDNGSEFSNPSMIENHIVFNEDGTIVSQTPRTKLFYCDPKSPEQKAVCERNHEFIRRFIPKGVSFDSYTPTHIQIMTNHINSYKRPKIKMESPISIFIAHYGRTVSLALGLEEIPPNDIYLNASILK
ncbi:MAG: IS30 family transposase [Erysipelothrix sp.]|nr:IS30 family transposase [Erysipelothrix sp.]